MYKILKQSIVEKIANYYEMNKGIKIHCYKKGDIRKIQAKKNNTLLYSASHLGTVSLAVKQKIIARSRHQNCWS